MLKKLGGILVAALVLAACNGGDDAPDPSPYPTIFNLWSDVRLSGAWNVHGDIGTCRGDHDYADVKAGAPVTLSDTKGNKLAVGNVQYGVGTNTFLEILDECVFHVIVNNVPRVPEYRLKIGNQKPQPISIAQIFASRGPLQLDLNPPLATTTTTTTTFVTP